MSTERRSPARTLRKLLDKLKEYTLDDDINTLIQEGESVLKEAFERASAANKASAAGGRNKQSPAQIRRILKAKGSLREVGKKFGISAEGVRKIRLKYAGNTQSDC